MILEPVVLKHGLCDERDPSHFEFTVTGPGGAADRSSGETELPTSASPRVSVLILTRNEEQDIQACLDSVSWSDDIHVYDSMSTDATTGIASRFGAIVTQRGYENSSIAFGGDEAAHRNWGLRSIPFKHQWVLQLDADERSNKDLQHALLIASQSTTCSAYRLRRRDFLMGTWLRHAQATSHYMRLFQPDQIHYERLINPVAIPHGAVGELDNYFEHFPFSKGLTAWIGKHNQYSTLEAMQIIQNRRDESNWSPLKAFVERDVSERRYHQKELFYRMPFRPLIKFLVLYVGKGGFLDGRAGFMYAALQAIYEYFIVLKTREIIHTEGLQGK